MEDDFGAKMAEMFEYNNWANAEVFRVCKTLTDVQVSAVTPGTFGTIRDTLEHILRSEAWYVRLVTGSGPLPSFRWQDKPDVAAMSEFLPHVGQALIDMVLHVDPDAIITEESEGQTLQYKAMTVLIQIINHGIEHRTNITTTLAQLGITAPEVDGWGYMLANRERMGPPAERDT